MPKASQVAPQPLVDSTESCRFYMIKAEFIRAYSGLKLPFFQEIRSKHPEAIVEVTITYAEVVSGTHAEKILSVSHRIYTAVHLHVHRVAAPIAFRIFFVKILSAQRESNPMLTCPAHVPYQTDTHTHTPLTRDAAGIATATRDTYSRHARTRQSAQARG